VRFNPSDFVFVQVNTRHIVSFYWPTSARNRGCKTSYAYPRCFRAGLPVISRQRRTT
jgi:hypothetical protein